MCVYAYSIRKTVGAAEGRKSVYMDGRIGIGIRIKIKIRIRKELARLWRGVM